MKNIDQAVRILSMIGLTEMESRIYSFLLTKNPATGYQIAREVDKPVANIYKSLSSLEIKGAVMVEGDKKRLYKPVPAKEFLELVEKKFNQQKGEATRILESLQSFSGDEKVYQLYSTELVFGKLSSMIKRAEATILLDAFPEVIFKIKDELIEVLKTKKLEVIVKVYEEIEIPGARVVMDSRGGNVLQDYPGEWVKMVIDGKEHLLGLLARGCTAVHQVVWSTSNFLSLLNHQSILSEVLLDEVKMWSKENRIDEIDAILQDYSRGKKGRLPGYRALVNRFAEK